MKSVDPSSRTNASTVARSAFAAVGFATVAAAFLSACAADEPRTASGDESIGEALAAAEIREVTVVATDFAFPQAPDTIPAGLTTFRLESESPIPHHAVLVRIEDGRTYDELINHIGTEHAPPRWATFVGGPNAPTPGEISRTTVDLVPGNYAILCWIPVPDGVPHVMKGMSRPLTVIPTDGESAPEPESDVNIVMDDYSFQITGELRAGEQTIRVETATEQPHEFVLAKLAPGASAEEFAHALESAEGPPPGKLLGGVTVLSRGEINYLTVDLEPGEYALVCPIEDAGDGRPHFMHGMTHQFTVGEV